MPAIAALEAPGLVGAFELAGAQAAKHLHFADAQHHQVGVAVTININRVGADGIRQLQARAFFEQLDRPALGAFVAVKLGAVYPGSDIHLGQAVAVAIESGDTAADHEFPFAFKAALQAGGIGFFDEAGNRRRRNR